MFDAKLFSELIKRAQGKRSLNEYARNSGVSSAYISKLRNMVATTAPSPVIIRKLADNTKDVSYAEMMTVAGHIPVEETSKKLGEKMLELEKMKKHYTDTLVVETTNDILSVFKDKGQINEKELQNTLRDLADKVKNMYSR